MPKRRPKNTAGLLALGIILAIDAVLAVWIWHWRQGRLAEVEPAQEGGRALAPIDAGEPRVLGDPLAAEPAELVALPASPAGRAPLLILPASLAGRSPAGPVLDGAMGRTGRLPAQLPGARIGGVQRPGQAALAAGGRASEKVPAAGRKDLPAALRAYRALKAQPRYRALARAWTEEFVRHSDLRAINHRYHQDGDALRFVLSAVRSPSFLSMLGRFAGRSDLQGFLRDLARVPAVSRSARFVVEDPGVQAAIEKVPVGGFGTLGSFAEAGAKGKKGQEELLRGMLQSNPELKRAVEAR